VTRHSARAMQDQAEMILHGARRPLTSNEVAKLMPPTALFCGPGPHLPECTEGWDRAICDNWRRVDHLAGVCTLWVDCAQHDAYAARCSLVKQKRARRVPGFHRKDLRWEYAGPDPSSSIAALEELVLI
jgi:hypothetical protein